MKKVLIVEDDKDISALQRDYLSIAGLDVTICSDGKSGLEHLLTQDVDIAILDVCLPYMDGFEILRTVREKKDIPILLVTSRKEEIDKIRGLGLGADDYLTKPFSPGELVARVNAHLAKYERLKSRFGSQKQSDKSDTIFVRGLEIQKTARRIFVNGQEVLLALKEFELLHFLATNPNHVFSKDALFEKIWGLDSMGDVSTVTVHIARIREKIETDSANPQYIETVWGAGYRFRV